MADTLEDKLAKIEKGDDKVLEVCKQSMRQGEGMHPSDFLIIGAAKRTLQLSAGFRSHIRERNFTCAAALLRLQLDTALRLFAATLTASPEGYAQAIFDGKHVDKIKDKSGNRLTDSYLAKRLNEDHPWVESVYKDLCDFVHLSNRHFFTAISKTNDNERVVHFQVSAKDPKRPDEDYFEIVDAYFATMRLTFGLAEAWQLAKQSRRESRSLPPATGTDG